MCLCFVLVLLLISIFFGYLAHCSHLRRPLVLSLTLSLSLTHTLTPRTVHTSRVHTRGRILPTPLFLHLALAISSYPHTQSPLSSSRSASPFPLTSPSPFLRARVDRSAIVIVFSCLSESMCMPLDLALLSYDVCEKVDRNQSIDSEEPVFFVKDHCRPNDCGMLYE